MLLQRVSGVSEGRSCTFYKFVSLVELPRLARVKLVNRLAIDLEISTIARLQDLTFLAYSGYGFHGGRVESRLILQGVFCYKNVAPCCAMVGLKAERPAGRRAFLRSMMA